MSIGILLQRNEDQKPDRRLEIVVLVIAIVALVIAIMNHRSVTRLLTLEVCYDWETHVFSGTLDYARWFAGGTMFYYRDADNGLHWVDVPWREPLEDLGRGDIITVTKQYKMACGCLAGRIVSRSRVAVEVHVLDFSVRHLEGR